jgi:hypothetical protein
VFGFDSNKYFPPRIDEAPSFFIEGRKVSGSFTAEKFHAGKAIFYDLDFVLEGLFGRVFVVYGPKDVICLLCLYADEVVVFCPVGYEII